MNSRRFYHLALGLAAGLLLFAGPCAAATPEKPPPRSIEDIARLLDHYKPDPAVAVRALAEADAPVPVGKDRRELAEFYFQRAEAAGQTGRVKQQIEDLRQARELGVPGSAMYIRTLRYLAAAEALGGNVLEAVRLAEEAIRHVPEQMRGHELGARQQAVAQLLQIGDVERARRHLRELESVLARLRRGPNWAHYAHAWTAATERARGKVFMAEGRPVEAEGVFLRAMREAELAVDENALRLSQGRESVNQDTSRRALEISILDLASSLLAQNRLVEAEILARRALRLGLERTGRASSDVAMSLGQLARIMAEQGRSTDAARLAEAALESHRLAGAQPASLQVAGARRALGAALVAQGRHSEAVRVFEAMREGMQSDPEVLKKVGSGDLDWVLAALRTGDQAFAERMAAGMLESSIRRFGEKAERTAEVRAFYAMTLAARDERARARQEFAAALPILLDQARNDALAESGSIKRQQRLVVLLESYIRLLARMAAEGGEVAPPQVAEETFGLADIARGSMVQRALAASAARASISDPALAALARREQDARRRIASLSELLTQLLAAPPEQQLPKIQASLREDIEKLKAERQSARKEIERRFPDYAELVDPKPASVAQVRRLLRSGEALVAWYFGEESGFVWGIGPKGEALFREVALDRKALAGTVGGLRRALDPGVADIDEIPAFDVAAAHRLYRQLLEPVRPAWADARVMLAIPHAELGQLPLSVLPSAESTSAGKSAVPFDEYRRVPWLARSMAVAQLPSVTALDSLRRLPADVGGRRSFIGFGDPIFSPEQARDKPAALAANGVATRGRTTIHLRNVPKTFAVDSADLALLPRLPDTGEEIREIARVLGADPERDIFLQLRASEAAVLEGDLSQQKVVMFATHGLVPGELNGLGQPALALSTPLLTGGSGDGLLTMDEILGLRLNADWVVLSACNTAAGDGAGSEAVSGLGRAFFYAGARALLVSNWPVETVAARLLMTDLFRRQTAEDIGKAEALRQAMLALIDSPGSADPRTGRPRYSYAHPLFWAPFIVVGD